MSALIGSATTVGFVLRGAASQTADLQQWQNSAGTILAKVDSAGSINAVGLSLTSTVSGTMFSVDPTYGGIKSRGGAVGFSGAASLNIGTNYTGQSAIVASGFAGQSVSTVIIKSVASQTSNLTEWQDSAGTVLASIYPTGFINTASGIGANTTSYMNGIDDVTATKMSLRFNSTSYGLQLTNIQAGAVGYIVKGAASQTADLQQWQDSSGTVLAQIDAAGNSVFNNISTTNNINAYYGKISANTQGSGFLGQISAIATSASTIGMVIRGAASQTANLQEWQDSAGVVLSKFDSRGRLIIGNPTSTAYDTYIDVRSTGGYPTLKVGETNQNRDIDIIWDVTGQSGQIATNSYSYPINIGNSYIYINNSANSGKVGINNTGLSAQLGITNAVTTNVGLIVKAAASQTANLQEWQNSSGTVLVKVTSEGVMDTPLITNAQTVSYTLVAADSGKLVEINNASGVTLTIPTNASVAYVIGTQINILQTGEGQITIAGASGVTVNATPGLKLRAQWSSATLIKRGTDTWVAIGDLSA